MDGIRKTLLYAVGIGIGFAIAVALFVAGWFWYSQQPNPWNSKAITARFELVVKEPDLSASLTDLPVQQEYTTPEFAAIIRQKYPQAYDRIPDDKLVQAWVKKYPVYQGRIKSTIKGAIVESGYDIWYLLSNNTKQDYELSCSTVRLNAVLRNSSALTYAEFQKSNTPQKGETHDSF